MDNYFCWELVIREILYIAYLNLGYEQLILTSISEVILKGYGHFSNNKFVISDESQLSKYEKEILRKIKLDKISTFHISDYYKWIDDLINECLSIKYLKYNFFSKLKVTKLFKDDIISDLNQIFNKNIVEYANSLNKNHLIDVIPEIKRISLPELYTRKFILPKKYPFNEDELDIVNEAIANKMGRFKTERWKLLTRKNNSR